MGAGMRFEQMRTFALLSLIACSLLGCARGRPAGFPGDAQKTNEQALVEALRARGFVPVEPLVGGAMDTGAVVQTYEDEKGTHAFVSLGKHAYGPKLYGVGAKGEPLTVRGMAARGPDGRIYTIGFRANEVISHTEEVDACPHGGGAAPGEPLYYVPLEGGASTYGGKVEVTLDRFWDQRFEYTRRGSECMMP